jgi:hypothetical protein
MTAESGSGANKRRHERQQVFHSGTLHEGDRTIDCIIKDISASGVQIVTKSPVTEQRDFVLEVDRAGLFPGRLVWRQDNRAGLRFLQDPSTVSRRIGAAWGISPES